MNYLFQKEFVPLIEDGTKQCTMRNTLRKGSKVGMPMTLYKGSRMKPELIKTGECLGIYRVKVVTNSDVGYFIQISDDKKTVRIIPLFAQKEILKLSEYDGFRAFMQFFDFHGPCEKYLFVWGEECNEFIKNLLK